MNLMSLALSVSAFVICISVAGVSVASSADSAPSKSSAADNTPISYPNVASNVSYRSVLQLATRQPDAKYSYGDSEFQFAELWLPKVGKKNSDKGTPVVVLIHGGCWLNAFDLKHTYAMSTALNQAGYAVWSLEYRRSGDEGGGWPGTFDDISQGIAYLKTIDVPSIDKNNLVIMGHSAGGHLALWYGAQPPIAKEFNIKGVIGLAAIVDLESYAVGTNSCQRATPRFMGGPPERFAKRYAQANPSKLTLHKNSYLIHGTEDNLVPPQQAKNSTLPTTWIEGAGHFDMIHPGSPAWSKVINTLQSLRP